jgi:hypothetical protein
MIYLSSLLFEKQIFVIKREYYTSLIVTAAALKIPKTSKNLDL